MANGFMRFVNGSRWAFFATWLLSATLFRAAIAFIIHHRGDHHLGGAGALTAWQPCPE
jgi:hypothetical protein